MNIVKKITAIILLFGIIPNVFSQEMLYKTFQKVNVPFYDGDAVRNSFLKQRTDFDTLWLPASVIETVYDTIAMVKNINEYHENGLLKKNSSYALDDGRLFAYRYFNNTYRDPLADILDTMFYNAFTDPHTGEYHPPVRYYYNHRQADSSYWEEFYQFWDGEKWNTEKRWYVHLLDTATVSEFQDHVEVFDGNGNLKQSRKTFLTFDNQGNVIEAVSDNYDLQNNQYIIKWVYTYDNEGKCKALTYYHYNSSGAWELLDKFIDLTWFEFHGFSNGDMLFFWQPTGVHHGYSPKNKNKISHYKRLCNICGTDKWEECYRQNIEWNNYPFSYHSKEYITVPKGNCLFYERYLYLNEQYHFTSEGALHFDHLNCDTVSYSWIKDYYTNEYDNRGRRYEYTWTNTAYSEELGHHYLKTIYTVDSFTYVIRPVDILELPADNHTLLIVPNPSDETVRITAADSIATVSFYASDGRLAYSRDGAGKEMTINIQGIAAGVYVVQARLKNGGVQAGKVVVR